MCECEKKNFSKQLTTKLNKNKGNTIKNKEWSGDCRREKY